MKRRTLTGRRARQASAGIDMAPLIDMVFILLIFYIVSTTFVQDAGVAVERPTSRSARALSGTYLPVAITKSGRVHVSGAAAAADDAEAVARALAQADTERVVIQADREVPTGLLLRVLDTCRQAGAQTVEVAALRE